MGFLKTLLSNAREGSSVSEFKAEESLDVVQVAYPKVVQEIHSEFLTAGDRLLTSAKEILANMKVVDRSKVNKLQEFGFDAVKEVKEVADLENKKRHHQSIASAISELQKQYPLYKVITSQIAIDICKKYNLVLGEVKQFTGFVPNKNLEDIATFFKNHPDDEYVYTINQGRWDLPSTKEEYDKYMSRSTTKNYSYSRDDYSYNKKKVTLNICAPIKNMDTRGYEVKNSILVKHVPDPVVMLKKTVAGSEYYIILTAWGDEASDENVVFQKNN